MRLAVDTEIKTSSNASFSCISANNALLNLWRAYFSHLFILIVLVIKMSENVLSSASGVSRPKNFLYLRLISCATDTSNLVTSMKTRTDV